MAWDTEPKMPADPGAKKSFFNDSMGGKAKTTPQDDPNMDQGGQPLPGSFKSGSIDKADNGFTVHVTRDVGAGKGDADEYGGKDNPRKSTTSHHTVHKTGGQAIRELGRHLGK